MKASELRIGNYLHNPVAAQDQDQLIVVDIITPNNIEFIFPNNPRVERYYLSYEYLEPIPLTEEWLVKFGFKWSDTIGKSPSFLFIMIGGSELHINPDNGVVWIERNTNVFNNPALIEYVHQLQNLYFSLTGEELTIKE